MSESVLTAHDRLGSLQVVYFGRCLPWMVVDQLPQYFGKYKLQEVSLHASRARSLEAGPATFSGPPLTIAQPLTLPFDRVSQAKMPSAAQQWKCTKYVLATHFTVELPQVSPVFWSALR